MSNLTMTGHRGATLTIDRITEEVPHSPTMRGPNLGTMIGEAKKEK